MRRRRVRGTRLQVRPGRSTGDDHLPRQSRHPQRQVRARYSALRQRRPAALAHRPRPATNTDTPYASDLAYNPLGQLKQLKHSNGVIDSGAYDPRRHWLDGLEVSRPGQSKPLYSATYGHHPDANISRLTETAPSAYTERYHYDDLSRLTKVTASDPGRTREYAYDAIGRMTSSSTAGSYRYEDSGHVHAPTATDNGHRRTYDANGNLITLRDPGGRRLSLRWTTSDMPQRITSRGGTPTVMGYDADDQRVLRRNRNGAKYYLGPYLERNLNGRLVKHYWAGNQLIARRVGNKPPTELHQADSAQPGCSATPPAA